MKQLVLSPVSHTALPPLVQKPQGTALAPDQSEARTGSSMQIGSGESCCCCGLAADRAGGEGRTESREV